MSQENYKANFILQVTVVEEDAGNFSDREKKLLSSSTSDQFKLALGQLSFI